MGRLIAEEKHQGEPSAGDKTFEAEGYRMPANVTVSAHAGDIITVRVS
jgi:hypothetical protein